MKNSVFDEDKKPYDKLNHVIIKNGNLIQGEKKIMSSEPGV